MIRFIRRARVAGAALPLALVLAPVLAAAQAPSLAAVLDGMAAAGSQFRGVQADIERTKVTVVIDFHDTSSGRIYFAGRGGDSRIRMSITAPAPQELLVEQGKARVFSPRINQVQEYDLGDREDAAAYLMIGFGPANASLSADYEVSLAGEETIDGIRTSILDLKPRSAQVAAVFSTIRLWVDQQRWIPVQNRLNEAGGDYQVVKYSNVDLDGRIPDSVFRLNLPSNVQVIRVR